MAYFPDNSVDNAVCRVGWLDSGHPFTTGAAEDEFLSKLKQLYRTRVNEMRGYHICEFCPQPIFGIPMDLDGNTIKLGSAEIHLTTSANGKFAAPDLIYHYVVAHGYLPPQKFIEAVKNLV